MQIHTVIFDIGEVLLRWDPLAVFDRAIGQARRETLFAKVPLMEMNLAIDRGADFDEAITELAAAHSAYAEEIELWRSGWREMIGPAVDDSVAMLRALRRKGIPVWALSNFGAKTFEIAEAEFPFLEEFDQRFISGHLGTIKPEAEIYEIVEASAPELDPRGFLFIDDRQENTDAAAARGWQVHRFTGPEGLRERLTGAGLIDLEAV